MIFFICFKTTKKYQLLHNLTFLKKAKLLLAKNNLLSYIDFFCKRILKQSYGLSMHNC